MHYVCHYKDTHHYFAFTMLYYIRQLTSSDSVMFVFLMPLTFRESSLCWQTLIHIIHHEAMDAYHNFILRMYDTNLNRRKKLKLSSAVRTEKRMFFHQSLSVEAQGPWQCFQWAFDEKLDYMTHNVIGDCLFLQTVLCSCLSYQWLLQVFIDSEIH